MKRNPINSNMAQANGFNDLSFVLDCVDQSLVVVGANGKIRCVNSFCCRTFGSSAEELADAPVTILFAPGNVLPDAETVRRDHGGVWRGDIVRTDRQGRQFRAHLVATAAQSCRETLDMVFAIHDLPRDETATSTVAGVRNADELAKLTADTAHDLNNLLTPILAYSQIMAGALEGHRLQGPLREIQKCAQQAADLSRRMLTFSRTKVADPTELDLTSMIRDMESLLERAIGSVGLVTRLSPDVSSASADQHQVQQAVLDVVLAVREGMGDQGVLLLKTGNVRLDGARRQGKPDLEAGSYVVVSAVDVAASWEQPRDATEFQHLVPEDSGIRVVGGPGSGLSLYFPAVEAPGKLSMAPEGAGHETVLPVDDEPSAREVTSRLLRDNGYVVIEAATGLEAIELVNQRGDDNPIDLLLADVVMPVMDGVELAARVNRIHPKTKVLFTSGYPRETLERYGVDDGAALFLPKPITTAALASRVIETLSR